MQVQIITTTQTLYEGEAKLVGVPGTKGRFTLLNNHAPIVSSLTPGQVRVVNLKDETTTYDIQGGLVESSNNKVILLAEV